MTPQQYSWALIILGNLLWNLLLNFILPVLQCRHLLSTNISERVQHKFWSGGRGVGWKVSEPCLQDLWTPNTEHFKLFSTTLQISHTKKNCHWYFVELFKNTTSIFLVNDGVVLCSYAEWQICQLYWSNLINAGILWNVFRFLYTVLAL